MSIWAGLKGLLGAGGGVKVLGDVLGTVDALHTSAEERAALRSQVVRGWVEAQAGVIAAEAAAGGLAALWRPLLMLIFGAILVWATIAETFGYPSPKVTLNPEMWELLKLGIGGYIGGRSLEKIVHSVVPLKKKERIEEG